jgi:hypothetical protein
MAAQFVTTIKTNEIPVGGVTAIDVQRHADLGRQRWRHVLRVRRRLHA